MKETLAAALVQLSFYRKDRVLVDPCCGSGTIPIEAAMIARNIAPGLSRNFASEKWEMIPDRYGKKRGRLHMRRQISMTSFSISRPWI